MRTCHTRDFSKGTTREMNKTKQVEYVSSTENLPMTWMNPQSIQNRQNSWSVKLSRCQFKKQKSRDNLLYQNGQLENNLLEAEREDRE